MKRIYLYGHLKEKFGEHYDFDVASPKMAVRALTSQLKGFKQAIKEGSYVLIYGDKKKGLNIGEECLDLKFGNTKELHIVPFVEGSGGKTAGVIKIVLGVTLLAIGIGGAVLAGTAVGAAGIGVAGGAFAGAVGAGASTVGISFGTIAAVGLALSALGASALLTSRPQLDQNSYDARESADNRQSFLFNGAVNKTSQGQPVPLVYGRVRVGSVVISAGLHTEAI